MPISFHNNLMALGVSNNLENHYARLSVSVQRLSSGLRINSAADDAAGIAIRELMRSDVAALNQGMRNASDAISMIQVADGALGVIDEKLIRMKELAEQAATGTYDSTQRLIIDSEYKAMAAEIDRIARATDFNGIKLLDGSLSGAHDGKGLQSTGKMKIHFGTANDSAEDYYYVQIGGCTTTHLGLTAVGSSKTEWVRVEITTHTPEIYKQQSSYVEYTDPDTGRKYYNDGNYYFSDINDPAGSRLSEDGDKTLIARLRTEKVTIPTTSLFQIWNDSHTGGTYYYQTESKEFYSDANNLEGTRMDPANPADKAIIDRLVNTGQDLHLQVVWDVYTDPRGREYYTRDGGITFEEDYLNPGKKRLDTRNPADKAITDTFVQDIRIKKISSPVIHVESLVFTDPATNTRYYSRDGGKTFFSNNHSPESTVVTDKNILDRLVQESVTSRYTMMFDTYRDSVTKKLYYSSDKGATFVLDVYRPDIIAFSSANPADQAAIQNLELVYDFATGSLDCDIYQDTADGHKSYYTFDNGKTFFSSTSDPQGSLYTGSTASFVKTTGTASITTTFYSYSAPGDHIPYYSCDGGKTFVRYADLNKVVLDSANPADQAMIAQLTIDIDEKQGGISFDTYVDPLTGKNYYKETYGSNDVFRRAANPRGLTLDPADPADKAILDRLQVVPSIMTTYQGATFPDQYYLYEDSRNGKIYYTFDDGKTFTSRPTDPYNRNYLLDPAKAADKAVLDNLRTLGTTTTKVEYIAKTVGTGGGVAISTQEAAQKALVSIDNAIVSKDKIRAHLGALQNRLENTVTNLNIQAESMQNAKSRVSDADIANEMTIFVRNQILTQSAMAMLGQANSYPHMLMGLING